MSREALYSPFQRMMNWAWPHLCHSSRVNASKGLLQRPSSCQVDHAWLSFDLLRAVMGLQVIVASDWLLSASTSPVLTMRISVLVCIGEAIKGMHLCGEEAYRTSWHRSVIMLVAKKYGTGMSELYDCCCSCVHDHSSGAHILNNCMPMLAEDGQGRNLEEWLSESCDVCKLPTDEAKLIMCDNEDCKHFFHMYCLTPPLSSVPDDAWYCPRCVNNRDDGVESGAHSGESDSDDDNSR